MISPVFAGIVEGGNLTILHKDMFDAHVRSLEGSVTVTLKRRRRDRSNQQNKYYWGVVVETLWKPLKSPSPELCHDGLRNQFLTIQTEPLRIARSTSSLSTAEFEEYVAKIRGWAQETHGIYIPLPNEVEYE